MLIGLDISTICAIAIPVSLLGRVPGSASSAYPRHSPKPLWCEQDLAVWRDAAHKSIRQTLEETNADPKIIYEVGLMGLMYGLVLLNAQDRLLRPAILWNDQRTSKACEVTVKEMDHTIRKPEDVECYTTYYQQYRSLFSSLKGTFRSLSISATRGEA